MPQTSDRARPGNVSYAGYEYQIEVTAWLALDLLMSRGIAEEISIEDPSCEDVEAIVTQQDAAGDAGKGRPFSIQIKSRSTGPWTSADFIKVLTGEKAGANGDTSAAGAVVDAKDASATAAGADAVESPSADGQERSKPGPAKRDRPLAMLKTDATREYVFVTDGAVEKSLLRHVVAQVGDASGASTLPGSTGRDLSKEEKAAIAGRIAILPGLPRELVAARTADLLRRIGHVPLVRHVSCKAELVETVRKRLLGADATPLRRVEVEEIMRRHDGSLTFTAQMDRYVAPKCLPTIEDVLATRHAVIIVGPSGTGKTMTAEVLEARFRDAGVGFESVTKEGGLEAVAAKLNSPHPVVFHLRDPWGSLRFLPASRPWTEALVKLLRSAKPDKKFLVTTRSDVLHEAGGLTGGLAPYIVPIEPEDYDVEARSTIYDNYAAGLTGPARDLASRFRERAMRTLRKPFEVDRFFANLTLAAKGRCRFDDLVRKSQGEAIAQVVEQQILASDDPANAVAATSIVWSLATALGSVPTETVAAVRRRMSRLDRSFKVEVVGFVATMIQARNLRAAAGSIAMAHPQVEDGFRRVMTGNVVEAEAALALLVRALVDLDPEGRSGLGMKTANDLRAQLPGLESIELDLEPAVTEALDRDLETAVLQADEADFTHALDRLALLAGDALPTARFARLLRSKRRQTSRGYGMFWTLPAGAVEGAASLGSHKGCQDIARRMIADALPSTSTSYNGQLVALLHAIDTDIEKVFIKAITCASIERFSNPRNLRVVVEGALAGANPPYDRVIATFLVAQRSVDARHDELAEGLRQAREEVLDEAHGRHLFDEAHDESLVIDEGFLEAVAIFRRREGFKRLAAHPEKRGIFRHWVVVAKDGDPPASALEIATLLSLASSEDEMAAVWRAVAKASTPETQRLLLAEMGTPGSARTLRHARLAAFMAFEGAAWRQALISLATADAIGDARVVEIALDLAAMRRSDEDDEADAPLTGTESLLDSLPSRLSALVRLVLTPGEARRAADGARDDGEGAASELAATILTDVAPDLGAAILTAMPAAANGDVLERYATGADVEAAVAALCATAVRTDAAGGERLSKALDHGSMLVRQTALTLLLPGASDPQERSRLSRKAAGDESSRVRLTFARAMKDRGWLEARGELCNLLKDNRDFADMYAGEDGSDFEVARAAAEALSAQPDLAPGQMEALRSAVDHPTDDAEVAYAALRALETRPGYEIGRWLSRVANRRQGVAARESDRTVGLAWEAYLALARRGEAGLPLEDAFDLDELVSASAGVGSDIATAALLAASTNLDAERLERLMDVLAEDARALLVVAVMFIRSSALRERVATRLEPERRMGDKIAAVIHSARGDTGDEAAAVSALADRAEFEDWARRLGGHPAAIRLRSMFDDLGLWPPLG